jgi:mannose-6-phosphate isomerase-like protein (cupin superfamily)
MSIIDQNREKEFKPKGNINQLPEGDCILNPRGDHHQLINLKGKDKIEIFMDQTKI